MEPKPNGKQNHVLVHTWSITAREWNALMKAMHGNGTHRVEWGPRALVWLPLILLACPDTTGMPERRKGVDVVRPHRRYGNSPSRMAGKERERSEATELYD